MKIAEERWKSIEHLISTDKTNNRGRPPLEKQEVLNGILWVLENGRRWKEMPNEFPQYQTCRNYFYEWSKQGSLEKIFRILMKANTPNKDHHTVDYLRFSRKKKRNFSKIAKRVKAFPVVH